MAQDGLCTVFGDRYEADLGTSGIEDASRWFGKSSWIFDVQSKDPVPDCPECVENGQLLIVKVGGDFDFRRRR